MEKLKKLINQMIDAPKKLIYSVKYLPQILYFGGKNKSQIMDKQKHYYERMV